jgi:hypothetical protein
MSLKYLNFFLPLSSEESLENQRMIGLAYGFFLAGIRGLFDG